MRRLLMFSLLAFSLSASAAEVVYVYPYQFIRQLPQGTVEFITPSLTSFFINCAKASFDDPTHDKVSGFANRAECEAMVARAKASPSSEFELRGTELTLRVRM